jgi:peroxiredoxin
MAIEAGGRLPGACVPTCSTGPLPRSVRNAGALRAQGIDTVAWVAVGDVYGRRAAGEELTMPAGGKGELARARAREATRRGMGRPARRCCGRIEDGIVTQPQVDAPGECGSRSADGRPEQP